MMLTRDRNILVSFLSWPKETSPCGDEGLCSWALHSAFPSAHSAAGSLFKAQTQPHFRGMEVQQIKGCWGLQSQRGFGRRDYTEESTQLCAGFTIPSPYPRSQVEGPMRAGWTKVILEVAGPKALEVSVVQLLRFHVGSTLGMLVNCQSPERVWQMDWVWYGGCQSRMWDRGSQAGMPCDHLKNFLGSCPQSVHTDGLKFLLWGKSRKV